MSREPGDPPENRSTRRGFLAASVVVAGGIAAGIVGVGLGAFPSHLTKAKPDDVDLAFSHLDGTGRDASSAFERVLAQNSSGEVAIRGDFTIDREVRIPHHVTSLILLPGTVIRVRGDHVGLSRRGAITLKEVTRKAIRANATRIGVRAPGLYDEDEYLLVSGADVVSGSPDHYGYLRKVVSLDRDHIELDRPVPRGFVTHPRTSAIAFAPRLSISGDGTITSTDPSDMHSPLIEFFATMTPHVSGVTITESGGSGVHVSHCLGGQIDCTISDLLDDGREHFGYGVNVTGSTRELTVLGDISRVRHAVTTNAGPLIDGVGNAGEPEDCYFAPRATDCSDKSIDTHRLGWGIVIEPFVRGGGGGVQIRSDNATVFGGDITGSRGPGITVTSVVAVPARLLNVKVSELAGHQTGILCRGPAQVIEPDVHLTRGTGIELESHSTVVGGSITGTASDGVIVNGSGNTIRGIEIGSDVERRITVSTSASANVIDPAQP